MSNVVRVLVVEDDRVYRDGLCSRLSAFPGVEVVGVASSGHEAVELAERLDPDAVLMDIELGGEPNGIKAGQAIKSASPFTGIVLLSAHNNRQYLAMGEEAGGWSYFLKKNLPDVETLVDAIEGSLWGKTEGSVWGKVVVDPQLVVGYRPRPGSPLSRLPEERLKLLELAAQGHSDRAIGAKLQIGEPRAVRDHLAGIYQELGIDSDGDPDPRVKAVLAYIDQTSGV